MRDSNSAHGDRGSRFSRPTNPAPFLPFFNATPFPCGTFLKAGGVKNFIDRSKMVLYIRIASNGIHDVKRRE